MDMCIRETATVYRAANGRRYFSKKSALFRSVIFKLKMRHEPVRGVSFCRRTNKWTAKIKVSGKNLHLGSFHTIADAVKAYENKSRSLYGDYYLSQLEVRT